MKKILIFAFLFSTYNLQSNFKQKLNEYVNDLAQIAFMQYATLHYNICNNWIVNAFKTKDLSKESDYILAVIYKDNLYQINLLNIYNLKKQKDEYCPEESVEVNLTNYELIKQISSKKLNTFKSTDKYLIKLNESEFVDYKTEDNISECFFINNKDVTSILDVIYNIDEE